MSVDPEVGVDPRSSKQQQIANSVTYLVPVVVGNLVPIVTLPIFSRLLSAEDFGAWALANAYSVVVAGLATVGLQSTYDRNFFEYRSREQAGQLLYSVLAFSVVAYVAFGLLTWFWRGPITRLLVGDLAYSNVLVCAFATSAVAGLKAYYLTYLKNGEQAAAFSAYTIAERLLSAVLQVLLIAWVGLGVMGLVVGQLAATAAVLFVVASRTTAFPPFALAAGPLLDSLRLGVPLLPRFLLVSIGNNVDKILIGQIASLGGVGIYSVGQRVANIAFTYMTALQNVFTPRVYRHMFAGGPDAARLIGLYLTPFAYVTTVISFLIALFSEEILTLVAPESYHGAIPIVTVLVLHYAILFFGKMPQIPFSRRMYLVPVLTALSTSLNVAMGAIGIWLMGTVGAAWGALAAGILYTTTAALVGQRCFRIEWETRKLTAIFGLLFASALATIALRYLGTPYLLLLLSKLCMVAAFVWLGWRLRILTRENLAMIRSMAGRAIGRRSPAPEPGGAY